MDVVDKITKAIVSSAPMTTARLCTPLPLPTNSD
jgi:hypothetical protein